MRQIDQRSAAAPLPGGTASFGRQERAMEVEERLRCMCCRRMVYKHELKAVPQEPGKTRRVARLACPKCIDTINAKRKAARKAILKILKKGNP